MTLYQYSGSGSLSEFSSSSNNITVSYNLSSVYLYTTEDFGNVFESQPNGFSNNTIDFSQTTHTFDEINVGLEGLIFNDYGDLLAASETEDYGPITGFGATETLYPFGTITLSGSAITQSNYRLYFTGSAIEKFVHSPDNLSGSLFGFGEKIENRSYDYNLESVFNDSDDYGSITNISGFIDDYETITEPGLLLEYGLITEPITGGIVLPFGTITLSGSAITQPNYRLYFSGSAIEKFVHSPDNLSGSLFGFGQKIESITFDYNETSISENILDYGLISNEFSGVGDYGNLSESSGSSAFDNYGLISDPTPTETFTYPFGTLSFSGSSSQLFVKGPYSPSGSIFVFSGSAYAESFTADTPDNTQLFQISGSALPSDVDVYVGIGTLFSVGEKVESVTYDYNIDSITTNSLEDFGLVSIASTESSDWGLITLSVDDGIDNLGSLIGNPFASTPFGTITLSGDSLLSFQKGPFIPSGSIVFSGFGGVQSFTANTPDNTQLFQISGSALTSDVDIYVGIGTLFKFGEKIESVTYDYNESSISDNEDDFGLITNLDTQFSDYGFISESGGGQVDDDYGLISQVVTAISGYPFGSLVISGTASDIKETDSYVGLGTIFLSSQSELVEVESYDGSGTIFVSGTAVEKDIDSYVGVGTLTLSTSAFESEIEIYAGSGTLTLSGIATERVTFNPPETTQLFQISGTAVEKDVDSYVGFGTIFISGELVHPNIDYTPHYGIEKNIGIGTTGIQLSGSATDVYSAQTPENTQLFQISGIATERVTFNPPENNQLFQISGGYVDLKAANSYVGTGGTITLSSTLVEKNTESYVGVGTVTFSGTALESLSAQTPENIILYTFSGTGLESETEVYTGLGTAFIDVSSRNYSPVYPRNALPTDPSSGIGTIRINDDDGLTITRAVLPYFAKGGIVLSNTGNESFTRTNYDGSGLITVSGVSSTREIAVYTAVGFGTITFATETLIETDVDAYSGSGSIIVSGASIDRRIDNYNGTGSIAFLSGASESLVAQTPENTQLFTIFGSAADAYSAQTPETEVLYQFSGNISESRTYGYEGSGQATFSSAAVPIFEPRVFGTGLIRFATYLSDSLYDTCDSTDLTADYQISAFVKFVSNPPENTVLYNFNGSASTTEIQVYTYSGFGSVGISGSHISSKTKSVVGIGTLSITSTAVKKDIDSYVGSGSIAILSGSAESKVSVISQSTVLFSISGVSSTRTFNVKTYSGVGTAYFSGSASTKVLSRRSYSGVGTIYLSGELVHPNIKFIPASKGAGLINITGSGLEKIGYKYLPIPQTLFAFSGGFESFTKTGYIGVGTIYIQPTSSSTINNPYQIPRVYVTII